MRRSTAAVALIALGTVLGVAAISRDTSHEIVVAQAPATAPAAPAPAVRGRPDNPGFYAGEANLTPSERAGREIWYKATAGNARFHTYVFQQRVNVLIDWYRVLNAGERERPLRGVGDHQRSGLLRSGVEGLSGQEPRARPTASIGVRATRNCCNTSARQAIAIRPATIRMRRSIRRIPTTRPRISASRRAIWPSGLRPARWASASFPIPALTRRAGRRSTAASPAGKATAAPCRRIRSRATRRSTALQTVRSSRRS